MTFEVNLLQQLRTVNPRVFLGYAPMGTAKPYITVQQIGGEVINHVENTPPGTRNSVVQVNVWASTHLQAMNLSRQIEDAMRAATAFTASPVGAAHTDFDWDIPIHSAIQDFTCWFDDPA